MVADGGGSYSTSLTSMTIGTGTKVFSAIGYFKTGDAVIVTSSGGTMTGTVTTYVGSTLTLSIASTTGSGTFAYWHITNTSTAHSNATVAIGTGSKTFAISSFAGFNTDFVISCPVTVTASGGSMTGTVTSYGSGNLVVNVTSTTGSGTYSSWAITGGIGQPHNWIGFGGYPNDSGNIIFQVKGVAPNKYIQQEHKADAIYGLRHYSALIASGQSVAFEVVVKKAPWYGNSVDSDNNPV